MKNVLILILVISSFAATAQDSTKVYKPKNKVYLVEYYETGELETRARYKLYDLPAIKGGCTQGVPAHEGYILDGKWTEYYKNGNKKTLVIYKDGKMVKVKKRWNEDGSMSND